MLDVLESLLVQTCSVERELSSLGLEAAALYLRGAELGVRADLDGMKEETGFRGPGALQGQFSPP